MQSSVGIRERIDHVYPSLRPAERAVAQYIRNHIEEAADLTVGQMADIAHVSQPTVIRFARKLGFGGYRELRYVLRNPAAEHKVTFNPLAGFDLNPWDGEDEIPGKAADGAKALIDELHSALDPKAYRKAVALLAESEFIDIFGVENSLTPAMDLFTKLGYLGLTCRLNTDAYLQQIGAGHPEMKEACCIPLCQLFLKKDESQQKKAASFISKYGDASSSTLQEALLSYQPEMFQSVQDILVSFMKQPAEEAGLPETTFQEKVRICREDNRIPFPANKEDFLFQLSRLFDMNESWETDTAIAALIAFHPQLDEEDFSRMEPVFQRAANIIINSWAVYENFLATFLLEYQRLWTQKDTANQGFLSKLFTRLEERLKGIDANRGAYDERAFKRLADWQPAYSNRTCFEPIKQLWLEVIRKIQKGDSLPLLSTPTHSPAYIQATELVRRLAVYQEANARPCSWDFQLAIARCALEDKEEAIAVARQLLNNEYLHLCLFLLDKGTQPEPPYNHPSAWLAAGLVKEPDTEFEAFKNFSCNTLPHNYLTGNYGWKEPAQKENQYAADVRLLQLDFYKWHEYAEHNSHQLWQEHLIINSRYNIGDSDYMERLFSFFPNQPEPLVAQIINCYMDFGSPQEESKRSVANALRMLLSFHCPLREMSLLLLGGGLLFTDKTVRSYAAELWVEGIANNRIDNHRLGEIVARIINMGIVPLKRFTTEVYESIYKRSTFHNQQLEELLTVLIGGLPDNPVTGQKQLLELYAEVLRMNGHCVTDEKVRKRLEMWKKNTNLKKVVTALER